MAGAIAYFSHAAQLNKHRPPSSGLSLGSQKRLHIRQFFENGLNRTLQSSCALPVDDPYLEYSLFATGGKIFGYEVFDFTGLEGMKVEGAVDGKFDRAWLSHKCVDA